MHFGLWQILVLVSVVLGYINHVQRSRPDPVHGRRAYAFGGLIGYGTFLFFLVKAGTFH
jgi:hypothetical protein